MKRIVSKALPLAASHGAILLGAAAPALSAISSHKTRLLATLPSRSLSYAAAVESPSLPTKHDYIAGIKLPKVHARAKHEDYFRAAGEIMKEHTYNSASDIVDLANQAEQLIPAFIPNPDLMGQLLKTSTNDKGRTCLIKVSKEEALKADVIVFLGLDTADTEAGTVVGLRGFSDMLFGSAGSQGKSVVSFFPSASRSERYKQGLVYTLNESNVDEHAKVFAGRYIMPRFLDGDNTLLPPEKVAPFVLAGYSLGAREIAMVENACISFFKEIGMKPDKIQSYMDRYTRLNLGHAVNWETSLADKPTSRSFSVLSLGDMGIRKSSSLMDVVYHDTLLSSQPLSLFRRAASDKELLAVVGDGQISGYTKDHKGRYKLNPLGHGMEGYFSVAPLLEKAGILPLIRSSLAGEEKEVPSLEGALRDKSEKYDPYRAVCDIDPSKRQALWGIYLANQQELAQKFNAKGKVIRENNEQCNSPNWQKYVASREKITSHSKGPASQR